MRKKLGIEAYNLACELFPLNRSLINADTAHTLRALTNSFSDNLIIHQFPTGSRVGDWLIPKAWDVKDAYIADKLGNRIIDWKVNNLHLVSYSIGINKLISREELLKHLFFDPNKPDWIPYRTSYYTPTWGFCVAKNDLEKFSESEYQVFIDVEFSNGQLEVGDLYFPGKTLSEVVFTSYICHPSMANNELSGPVVLNALAKIISQKNHYYSYRFLLFPETIGSIAYISKNITEMRKNIIAGFVITCVGDRKSWGHISSRTGINLADKVAVRVFKEKKINVKKFTFLERGSDERQFCSPAVDLPFTSITRSKHGTYPEYHTSGDNLQIISSKGLYESVDFLSCIINNFEQNRVYKSKTLGEPFYMKHSLRNPVGGGSNEKLFTIVSNIVALCDGSVDTAYLSEILKEPINSIKELCNLLLEYKILEAK